jgi:hypothetical protein
LLLVALSGCASVSSRVHDRFAAAEPKLRTFEAPLADTFFAAQAALKEMDFTVTNTAQAQGRIEARSRVIPGDSLGGARQFFFTLKVSGPTGGPTEVAAVLRQGTEGEFRAGPDSVALREHGLYVSLFSAMQTLLHERPASAAPR